ncbi:SH3 domain protein, putative [Trypanosoma cruzi marinkellei]|uniref:SH3 domain protein, putative n=1 Tax=Trypanosoma cruzi marinkellei TaxID=85056 RepID=K2P9K9_TRYCR|nr:SH3 domain protein, putative [Trypanosoma cruzi marinkellei]
MRYFRVLHNFDAQDGVELTVKKGETVFTAENEVREGWIKVEVLHDPRRRGFVPFNYLRETTESLAREQEEGSRGIGKELGGMSVASMTRQPSAIPRETSVTFTSGALDYGDRLQNMYGVGASAPSPVSQRSRSAEQGMKGVNENSTTTAIKRVVTGTLPPSQKGPSSPPNAADPAPERSLLSNPSAIVEAFMKNELHFKQLIRQRQDALAQMRTTVEEAMSELVACKEKNVTLARKLRELDQSVEKERGRWKERIMEEKAYISRSMSSE